MQIAVSRPRPDTVYVAAAGEIDAATAPRLADVLSAGLVAAPRILTLDLDRVGFCAAEDSRC